MTDQRDEFAEIRGLVEALVRMKVGENLERDFARNPKLRVLFYFTGRVSRGEVKKKSKLGTNTIGDAWSDWHARGLIRKTGRQYSKLWRE